MRYICRDVNGGNGQPSMHGFRLFFLFIAWHFETTIAPRKRERNIWYLFRLCTPYGSRVSLTGEEEEEEEERRKKMTIFKFHLLSFCTAELKSEDIFVLRRVRAFSGYSFCWLNPQTTCLFTLAYCTLKTFQPPSSLHRDCSSNLWYMKNRRCTVHVGLAQACPNNPTM